MHEKILNKSFLMRYSVPNLGGGKRVAIVLNQQLLISFFAGTKKRCAGYSTPFFR